MVDWVKTRAYYTRGLPMAFCINCGASNPADAVFCLSCGQTLYREPDPKPLPQPRSRKGWILAAVIICAAIIVISIAFSRNEGAPRLQGPTAESGSASTQIRPDPDDVLTIVALDREGQPIRQGSGFVLTADGLAGTNYHVLQGARSAIAQCCNGRVFEVSQIEGLDEKKDLILFRMRLRDGNGAPRDLHPVDLETSPNEQVGEKVTVVGSPQGLENTVSDGILSAVREYDSIRYLQITAPISPGSSGGPVFNESGRMIGIATFQMKEGQNLNFAISSQHLVPLLDQHLEVSLAELPRAEEPASNQEKTEPAAAADIPTESGIASGSLTGQFGGIVHNESVDTSAPFSIIVQQSDDALSGCMGVRQPLFGSGPLQGHVSGNEVAFDVTSAIGTIRFTGTTHGTSITGTYIVDQISGTQQTGTFTLERMNTKELGPSFGPANCPTDAEVHK